MQKKYKIISVVGIIAVAIILGGIIAGEEIMEEITEMDDDNKNQVQISVQNTIDSFDGDVTKVTLTKGKYYSFVIDETLTTILAHPRTELVNTPVTVWDTANISVEEMLEKLDEDGSVWVEYKFANPFDDDKIEHKTAIIPTTEIILYFFCIL